MMFGKTVGQFGHQLRMQRAADMLHPGHPSIGSIAESLGYQHQNSLTVAFHQYFGVGPKDYARRRVT
jgi:AraC-like DNA-binding protein